MKIHTRQSLANTAAERWKNRMSVNGRWETGNCFPSDSQETYEKLLALGETPDPDAVDAVIKNHYWTNPLPCHECREVKPLIAELGDKFKDDYETLFVCADCLQKALDAIKNEIQKEQNHD